MTTLPVTARRLLLAPLVPWVGLLGLCAAYIQGGVQKALDIPAALAELAQFGMPAYPGLVIATIVVELGASLLILSGRQRWLGALALAGFTLFATFVANRFWTMAGAVRFAVANAFFECLGLIGAFVLVAWHDLAVRDDPRAR